MARFITREVLAMTTLLVVAFLVLTNSTGFARGISAIGSNYISIVRTFQGRR